MPAPTIYIASPDGTIAPRPAGASVPDRAGASPVLRMSGSFEQHRAAFDEGWADLSLVVAVIRVRLRVYLGLRP